MDSLDYSTTALAAGAVAVVVMCAATLYLYSSSNLKKKVVLNPEKWLKLKLVEKRALSHNTRFFRFELPRPDAVLGLPIGQHVSLQGVTDAGEEFGRPYTPTSLDSDVGRVDLVIKVYPTGAMSQYLEKLKVGDRLPFKGPKGRFQYTPNMVRAFGMVAGGTGITPMYQVARAILENPEDKTKISLVSANVKEEDILLRAELDAMARDHPGQFSVYYVLNDPPEGWAGGIGYVTADIIKERLPPPAEDIKILRCGPPGMNKAVAGQLEALGYAKETTFQF